MASKRRNPGLRRCRRRGVRELNASPLLKQGRVGAGGVADGAVARHGRGMRHVVAERWDKAGERMCWAQGAVSVRPSDGPDGGTAWLNQQFRLHSTHSGHLLSNRLRSKLFLFADKMTTSIEQLYGIKF